MTDKPDGKRGWRLVLRTGAPGIRFVPSRVEGLPAVTEVGIFPDRLEVCTSGEWKVFPFTEIAQWPPPVLLWRTANRFGIRPRFLPIGERDWFHPPMERFFQFFTKPPIIIYMPEEPDDTTYGATIFHRIQDVMRAGGFTTWDLG
jgi:hypothetical protein